MMPDDGPDHRAPDAAGGQKPIRRPEKSCLSKPFALTYPIRPATIADLPFLNGSSRQAAHHGTVFAIAAAVRVAPSQPAKIHQGKVRDIYDVDADHLLIVTTDRLSAFDVVLPDPIPVQGRGADADLAVLVRQDPHIVANHLPSSSSRMSSIPEERAQLAGRAMVVKKLNALPIEAVVRGYLIGSGYKDIQAARLGVRHRPARRAADGRSLPEPMFTPASKAPAGQHDENIDFEPSSAGRPRMHARHPAHRARDLSLRGRARARARHHHRRYEIRVRVDKAGNSDMLIDEVLTPDSSRFWPLPRTSPASVRRVSTSNSCATIWNRCTGTRSRRRRILPPDISRAPATIIARRCGS
jgi:phosphoribosylaminoimidazole-succinocarboxamide synthase